MRAALISTLILSWGGICLAQAPAPANAGSEPTSSTAPAGKAGVEKRTERIHIEDAGSSIDELRIGGETQTITVQPKGRMPAYQIQPDSGERSWKILGF